MLAAVQGEPPARITRGTLLPLKVVGRERARDVGLITQDWSGYARDTADLLRGRRVTKVLSSLMFHQVPLDEISVGRGHSYRIVVSDLVRGRPIWFGGTDRSE